jgi:glycosyltransferase involved in cell wall biosynthesis
MNICMLTSAPFPPREGIGFYVWNLSRHLIHQGIKVQIITRGGLRRNTCEVVDGITIWRATFLPLYPFHVHLHGQFMASLINKVESDVDLFHIHSPLSPVISTSRPVMLTFHSSIPDNVSLTPIKSLYTLLMKLQSPISYQLERDQISRAFKVNAVSPHVAEVLKNYPGCPQEVELMWNGVDTQHFTPKIDFSAHQPYILTVTRLVPGKGLEDLILASAMVVEEDNSIQFLIAGDGLLKKDLIKKISELNLNRNVKLLGHISNRNKLIDLYRNSILFVFPSYHEGLPTVILEAMACGIPTIASNVGGIPWIITHEEDGVLIPPKDPSILADAICLLIKDPQRLKFMGKQARQTIVDRFAWDIISRNYMTQYKILLQDYHS